MTRSLQGIRFAFLPLVILLALALFPRKSIQIN